MPDNTLHIFLDFGVAMPNCLHDDTAETKDDSGCRARVNTTARKDEKPSAVAPAKIVPNSVSGESHLSFLAIEQRRDRIVVIGNEIFAAHVQVRLDARASVDSEEFDDRVLLRSACFDLTQVDRSCNNFNVFERELALLGHKFAMNKDHRTSITDLSNAWTWLVKHRGYYVAVRKQRVCRKN
jgi:hypothetical protein